MTAGDLLLVGAAAAGLTAVCVGIFLVYARRRALVAIPEARSSHTVPTPVGGGVGIIVAILGILAATGWFTSPWLPAALLVATATGFADDRSALSPRPKMLLIVAAAALAVPHATIHGVDLPYAGHLDFGLLSVPLTLFWLVSFTNAFNFMDGINGIAGVTLVVTGSAFAVGGLGAGATETAVAGAVLAGGGAGFLPWNFPKAKIFMGDAGALSLGLLIAVTAIRASGGQTGLDPAGAPAPVVLPFPAAVLLVGPYVFDVSWTLIRRLREGKNLGQAHKEHLYQRLARGLGSHARSTLTFGAVEAGTAWLALTYASRDDLGRVLSLLLPLAALLVSVPWVLRSELRAERASRPPER